jgi:hypothetical protein
MEISDYWTLTKDMRDLAEKKGFTFEMRARWILTRKADGAIIWPHIDGYISAFLRDGMYVKHKKFRKSFEDALNRKFGDSDASE